MSWNRYRMASGRWLALTVATVSVMTCAGLYAQTALQKALNDDQVAAHWIYDDFGKAMAEAKTTGKPILALLRCVP